MSDAIERAIVAAYDAGRASAASAVTQETPDPWDAPPPSGGAVSGAVIPQTLTPESPMPPSPWVVAVPPRPGATESWHCWFGLHGSEEADWLGAIAAAGDRRVYVLSGVAQ